MLRVITNQLKATMKLYYCFEQAKPRAVGRNMQSMKKRVDSLMEAGKLFVVDHELLRVSASFGSASHPS